MLAMVEMLLLRLNVICIHQILTNISFTKLLLSEEDITHLRETWTKEMEWMDMQVFQEQQSTNSKRGLSNNTAPSPKRWGENVDTSNRRCYIISRNKKRDRSLFNVTRRDEERFLLYYMF